MKVLWFSVTPSLYSRSSAGHNGGGWISSLEEKVKTTPGVELAVAFAHSDTTFKVEEDGVTYYPMSIYQSKLQRLQYKYLVKKEEDPEIEYCLRVIDDFHPDIIHVFGSEWSFGLVAKFTKIPVVIHIQGFANPYLNAYFPPGFSKRDFIFKSKLNIRKIHSQLLGYYHFRHRAERELRILKSNRYFMGRTEWDKSVSRLLSPDSRYFYCSESLRSFFFEDLKRWTFKKRELNILVSTISPPTYKGIDLVLKIAQLLVIHGGFDFEWRIFGVTDARLFEQKLNIRANDVKVKFLGVLSERELKKELLNASVFIHPSYIDNSPNSVCEAQLLGLPIVSTNVGGISSLIDHGETGMLIPANDPYSGAYYIKSLINDEKLSLKLSEKGQRRALSRHDPVAITDTLLKIYDEIVTNEKVIERIN
jgi:glycosyltransferase involved in cell wall biosynthesis